MTKIDQTSNHHFWAYTDAYEYNKQYKKVIRMEQGNITDRITVELWTLDEVVKSLDLDINVISCYRAFNYSYQMSHPELSFREQQYKALQSVNDTITSKKELIYGK